MILFLTLQPWSRKAFCPPEHPPRSTIICPLEPGPERVSTTSSFTRFVERWVDCIMRGLLMRSLFFFWLPCTVTGKLLGKRENSLITILPVFEIQLQLVTAFFSSVIFFPFVLCFNSSPIKVNQFEGHFMKLQADSNYLLSKEYEVRLRCRDTLAP